MARRSLLVSIAFASVACGHRPALVNDAGAPASSIEAPRAPACVAEPACDDERTAARCDGARRVVEACKDAAICVAGACVDPTWSDAALTAGADVQSLSDEGFLNAWSARAPLSSTQTDAVISAIGRGAAPIPELDGLPPIEPLCVQGSFVAPIKSARGAAFAITSAAIVAPKAGPAELWIGAMNRVSVYVGGKKVATVDGDLEPAPLRDETMIPVDLRAGVNSIAVVTERVSGDKAGFHLRLRGPNHAPLHDYAIVAPRCALADVAAIKVTQHPVAGGFVVDLAIEIAGAIPRTRRDVSYRLDLVDGPKTTALDEGKIGRADLLRGSVELHPIVKLAKSGSYVVRVTLDDVVGRELPILYRGDLHERVVAAAATLASADLSAFPSGSRDSIAAHVELLERLLAENDRDQSFLEQRLADAEALLAKFSRGEDPYVDKRNVVWRAYRSRLNGKLQPYLAYVPTDYRKGRPMPLVLALHGLNGEPGQALRTAVGDAPDRDYMNALSEARHLPPQPNDGVFLVAPWAYGNAGQRLPGEDDVLRVIEEMTADYSIERRRISITGYSLGGTVSFTVPLHYPDVFSAAAPLCGYPNFSQWSGVRDVPHTPWEDVLVERRSLVHYAENGLHVPLNIVHGGQDGPERSAVIADRYKELGYPRVFDVQDDLDHDVWEYGYDKGRMIGWLRMHERPETPAHVRLVSGEARYDHAYWISLVAAADAAHFASIDAEWDVHKKKVEATTKNVIVFAIDRGALKDVASFVIDGSEIAACGDRTSFLIRAGETWTCSETAPDRTKKKRAGVAGPLDDIERHPTIVVYGTRGAADTEVNRMVAESQAAIEHTSLVFPIQSDEEITDEAIATHSLILIGGPRSNRVTERLIASMPVRFEDHAIVLRDKRYEGDGVGVSLIAPNPKNGDEYVVLHAGVGPRGTLASRFLPSVVPDFLVYDDRLSKRRRTLLLGAREVLAGGFFDDDWK